MHTVVTFFYRVGVLRVENSSEPIATFFMCAYTLLNDNKVGRWPLLFLARVNYLSSERDVSLYKNIIIMSIETPRAERRDELGYSSSSLVVVDGSLMYRQSGRKKPSWKIVASLSGVPLKNNVLHETEQRKGSFQVAWNTAFVVTRIFYFVSITLFATNLARNWILDKFFRTHMDSESTVYLIVSRRYSYPSSVLVNNLTGQGYCPFFRLSCCIVSETTLFQKYRSYTEIYVDMWRTNEIIILRELSRLLKNRMNWSKNWIFRRTL